MSKQIIGKIFQVSKNQLQPPLLEFSSLVGQTNWWADEWEDQYNTLQKSHNTKKTALLMHCFQDFFCIL